MDSLKFGTSGLRGLVTDLEGGAVGRYTLAFLRHLEASGALGSRRVYVARDLRESGPALVADCVAAITGQGLEAVDCGAVATPALALAAMADNAPAIMVTGSHIPADRNGLKFYKPTGEIGKEDEQAILAALPQTAPTGEGARTDAHVPTTAAYRDRYRTFLRPDALSGMRVGVFEHSSVAREDLAAILEACGASVVPLGRAEAFVAVDTEAFSDDVFAPLPGWVRSEALDAIVSTDGDGDRPLVMDEQGQFVRGDTLGLIAARQVGADTVVTPVTSNSGIERTGAFDTVARTRVGSPYVIAGMEAAAQQGARVVVGFEANGGTLLGSACMRNGAAIAALPTRDAVLPILAVLGEAAQKGQGIAALVASLPLRVALSGRLTDVAAEKSAALMGRLRQPEAAAAFFSPQGEILERSDIDGLRFTLAGGTIVHFRASGNAPELRCYVEAETEEGARDALEWGLDAAAAGLEG